MERAQRAVMMPAGTDRLSHVRTPPYRACTSCQGTPDVRIGADGPSADPERPAAGAGHPPADPAGCARCAVGRGTPAANPAARRAAVLAALWAAARARRVRALRAAADARRIYAARRRAGVEAPR